MEGFLEEAKKLGLVLYQPCHEYDTALLQWWLKLNETEEFTDIFAESQRSLSKFLKIFEPPCLTVLAFDGAKLWAAIWFTPVGHPETAKAAFVGYWCENDSRGSKKQLAVTKFIYDTAFGFWKVLVGVTKHERLLKIHRRLGYNIVGSIPSFMEGEDAWIVYLTEENFKNSRMYKVGEN